MSEARTWGDARTPAGAGPAHGVPADDLTADADLSTQSDRIADTESLADAEPPDDADPEEIERHIERTREELGQTVDALVNKFDVKSQLRETQARVRVQAGDMTERGRAMAQEHRTTLIAAGAVVLGVVAALVVWRRRR